MYGFCVSNEFWNRQVVNGERTSVKRRRDWSWVRRSSDFLFPFLFSKRDGRGLGGGGRNDWSYRLFLLLKYVWGTYWDLCCRVCGGWQGGDPQPGHGGKGVWCAVAGWIGGGRNMIDQERDLGLLDSI